MKNTKLFSALLCGTMILAGCKNTFTGTEGSFKADLEAKYKLDENVNITNNEDALKVNSVSTSFTQYDRIEDKDNKKDTWEATITFNKSIKPETISGIAMLKYNKGTNAKAAYTTSAYDGASIVMNPSDLTNKTVVIKIAGDEADKGPNTENYLITFDATVLEAVDGAKLDTDDDNYWGEATEDNYEFRKVNDDTELGDGYFAPSAIATWSVPTITYTPDFEKRQVNITFGGVGTIESNKDAMSVFSFESYNAASDKWESVTPSSSAYDTTAKCYKVQIDIDLNNYKTIRCVSGKLNDVKMNTSITASDLSTVDVSLPYEGFFDKYTSKVAKYYKGDEKALVQSDVSYGYVEPGKETLTKKFTVKSKNNGEILFTIPVVDAYAANANTETKTFTPSKVTAVSGVSKDTIKVWVNNADKQDYKEVEVESVTTETINNEVFLKLVLADKKPTNANVTIVASDAVSITYEGILAGDTEKSTDTLKLGHMCPSTKTLTNNMKQIIYTGALN